MKKLLLTGFPAFLDHEKNPTEGIIQTLDGECVNSISISSLLLPVAFATAPGLLIEALQKKAYNFVICLGLADVRDGITPESVAINLIDCPGRPDNLGVEYDYTSINPQGASAYFSSLPIKKMVEKLTQNCMTAEISYTAGAYVCNHIMYRLLEFLDSVQSKTLGGFIHVPPGEVNELTKGIRLCIAAL